jgi:hypothetical protein
MCSYVTPLLVPYSLTKGDAQWIECLLLQLLVLNATAKHSGKGALIL